MSLYTSQASQTTYPTCSLEITPRRLQAKLIEIQSSINWSAEQSQDSALSLLSRLIRDENDDITAEQKLSDGKRWYQERNQLYICDDILMHSKGKIVCP